MSIVAARSGWTSKDRTSAGRTAFSSKVGNVAGRDQTVLTERAPAYGGR